MGNKLSYSCIQKSETTLKSFFFFIKIRNKQKSFSISNTKVQACALYLDPRLNVSKFVTLIILTALYKRSAFPHA